MWVELGSVENAFFKNCRIAAQRKFLLRAILTDLVFGFFFLLAWCTGMTSSSGKRLKTTASKRKDKEPEQPYSNAEMQSIHRGQVATAEMIIGMYDTPPAHRDGAAEASAMEEDEDDDDTFEDAEDNEEEEDTDDNTG
ncbi:hypothetical protein LR48_Vigan07g123000 [Vigna angularis]|uniref:Uncharacterized protein n=1 Tax=Phaseolus angularis TaxID=3914 RepID=A0A0L9UXT9_PHAAN|nr:hypothetical protein LR48_Vigan07g123000 [Vigna angularis]